MKLSNVVNGVKVVGTIVVGACVNQALEGLFEDVIAKKGTKNIKGVMFRVGCGVIAGVIANKVTDHVWKGYDEITKPMLELEAEVEEMKSKTEEDKEI